MAVTAVTLLTTFSPNSGQTHFYFDIPNDPTPTVKGVLIDWTDGEGDTPYTIEYSSDAGSSWHVVATGVAVTSYEWYLDETEYADIFTAGVSNANMLVRVSDNDVGTDTSDAYTFVKMSLNNIRPNDTFTDINGDTIHENPFHYSDGINILWDELHATDTSSVDVIIKAVSGGIEYKVYSGIPIGTSNVVWVMAHYILPATGVIPQPGTTPTFNGYYTVIVRGTAGGQHLTNSIESTQFMVTDGTKSNQTEADTRTRKPYERMDLFARGAGEKGRLLDEFITVAQLEAGHGVVIIGRDDEGKRVGADGLATSFDGFPYTGTPTPDSADYKKANNFVINFDESGLSFRKPRSMQGIFVPATADTSHEAGAVNYGSAFYYDIAHNWELGNGADPMYIAGQNRYSFHIEIRSITDDDVYDPLRPTQDTHVQYEPISANTIRCRIVKKGGAYQPTLAKDEVSATAMSDYKFEYVLVERLP